MTKQRHSLSNKNLDTVSAECAVCGPVEIKIKSGRSPQCINAWRSQKGPVGKRRKPEGGWPRKSPEDELYSYRYEGGRVYIKRSERRALFLKSDGKCSICKKELDVETAKYDHCHQTGEFRGFLCNSCNVGLGLFRDDTSILRGAIEYLSRNQYFAFKG